MCLLWQSSPPGRSLHLGRIHRKQKEGPENHCSPLCARNIVIQNSVEGAERSLEKSSKSRSNKGQRLNLNNF